MINKTSLCIYNLTATPLGDMSVVEQEGFIIYAGFSYPFHLEKMHILPGGLTSGVQLQLTEYFEKTRKKFTLPIRLLGTQFQQRVWKAVMEIPYGTVKSYGQIAREVGCIQGARAVGTAVGSCPLSIVVPCHRVIAGDGRIGGYGEPLWRKRYLLDLEGAVYKKDI